MFRITTLAALLTIAGSLRLEAQSFAQAQRMLREGQQVSVTDVSGTRTAGRLQQISPEAITVETGERQRLFTPAEVEQITARRKTPLIGTLIGVAAGAALGGFSSECGGRQQKGFAAYDVSCSGAMVFSGLVGAGVGAIVGSIPRTQLIYRTRAQATAGPLLQRDGVGMQARMRW